MSRNEGYQRGRYGSPEGDWSRGVGRGGDPWGGGRGGCRGGRADGRVARGETERRLWEARNERAATPWELLKDLEERLLRLEAKGELKE